MNETNYIANLEIPLMEWKSSARNSFAQKKVECLVFSFSRKKYFIVDIITI